MTRFGESSTAMEVCVRTWGQRMNIFSLLSQDKAVDENTMIIIDENSQQQTIVRIEPRSSNDGEDLRKKNRSCRSVFWEEAWFAPEQAAKSTPYDRTRLTQC